MPFLSAFERCVLERVLNRALPGQVGEYSAAWVRIHFRPESSAASAAADDPLRSPLYAHDGMQVSLEVSGSAPSRVTVATLEPGTVPDPARDIIAMSAGPSGTPEGMSRPTLLSGSKIQYTQEAFDHRAEGTMTVKCVITAIGTVEDCRIMKPLAYVELDVLRALAGNRYTPASFEGYPLNVDYAFTIDFKLPH